MVTAIEDKVIAPLGLTDTFTLSGQSATMVKNARKTSRGSSGKPKKRCNVSSRSGSALQ